MSRGHNYSDTTAILYSYSITMTYIIRDREAGNIIEEVATLQEAEAIVESYEAQDEEEGIYEDNFYEILEKSE
ncbi:MAG: hypothetical protein LBG59_06995 [Candidatus Peribacteria bacterium]|nr:hypothetical protein [Candidatus Peribacteria bacterium]